MTDSTNLTKPHPTVTKHSKVKFFDLYLQNPRRFSADLEKYLQIVSGTALSEQT